MPEGFLGLSNPWSPEITALTTVPDGGCAIHDGVPLTRSLTHRIHGSITIGACQTAVFCAMRLQTVTWQVYSPGLRVVGRIVVGIEP
jgi:hypothetical protein